MCGSFCTYSQVFPVLEILASIHTVTPIFSTAAYNTDSRSGSAKEHIERAEAICGTKVLCSISDVEPIGPTQLLDALVIAPCTGNTIAKLAHSIADGPVTMAAKSHLRNGRPVLIAVSTNDALAGAAENIACAFDIYCHGIKQGRFHLRRYESIPYKLICFIKIWSNAVF